MSHVAHRLLQLATAGAIVMSQSGPPPVAAPSGSASGPARGTANVELVKSRAGVEQHRLKSNGMDIVLVHSDAAPVITFLVVVRVGSRNEAPGNTGSAHLLEHLLFNKSTESFGRKSAGGRTIQEVLYEAGGDFSTSNMTTWCDRITMYDTLPSDQLETTMRINADRLRRGKILDEERQPEMTVVRNEYERGENDPSEALVKAVVGTAVQAHPYHWSTIGYRSDIEGVSTEKLREHYDTYFWPDNATAILVGDFDKTRALALFEKHFGGFPRSSKPIPTIHTVEPPQEGERRVVVKRAGAVAQVQLAWMRPGAREPGYHAFDVLASILGDGLSSRLHQALVETQLATSVYAWNWAFTDPFLLILGASVTDGVEPARVEAEMRKVVAEVVANGVRNEEVARARAQIEAQVAFSRDGTYGTAWTLGEAVAAQGWEWWVDYLDRIGAVTPQQIQESAKKHLGSDQVTVGWFVPKKEQAGSGGKASAPAGGGSSSGNERAAKGASIGSESSPPRAATASGRRHGVPLGPRFGTGGDQIAGTGAQVDRPGSRSAPPKGAAAAEAEGTGAKGFAQRTTRRVLPNGAVLLMLPTGLSDTVSVRVRLRGGAFLDGPRPGLAEATAEMLARGTKGRKKLEIASALEAVGSSRSWGAETYDVVGSGSCLTKNLPELLKTMVEELREPAFEPDELEKLKNEMKAAVLEDDDNTARRAFDELSRAVYPAGHPLRAFTAKERLEALAAFRPEDLRAFHSARYGSASLVVALSGRFDVEKIGSLLESLLSDVPRGTPVQPEAARVTPSAKGRREVRMADKANVDILIGSAGGLRRTDPDYYASILANAVLGQSGLSSRLGRQVRDTEGLTYVIISRFFSPYLLDGPWTIYLSVAPPNVEKGIASSMGVLRKFLAEGIGEAELKTEKSAAAGRFQVTLASNAGIADALAQAESYGLGISLLDEYPRKVRAVTLEEANRALRAHIQSENLVTVVAGSLPN